MSRPTATPAILHFDFVDPVSYLLDRELAAAETETGIEVTRAGVEISPPPHPLGTLDDAVWRPRWEEATHVADILGVTLHRPRLVPWSRKAHELMEHAREKHPDVLPELRRAVMEAFFRDGLDIGRVDVLVELATTHGMDRTETKAVLDVDRFGEDVARRRDDALEAGLRVVPSLSAGERRLEGFHNRASLSTFLNEMSRSS